MRISILVICAMFLASVAYSQTGTEPSPGGVTRVTIDRQGREAFKSKESIFNANGRIDEAVFYNWDAAFSREESQIRRSASGAIMEQIEFTYHDGRGPLQRKITRDAENHIKNTVAYEYNSQGKVTKESMTDDKSRPISSYEFSYDNAGNQLRRVFRNGVGSTLAITEYTFDNRKMARSETKDAAGTKISHTEYQYDNQGNLSTQQVYNADGKLTSTIKSTWQGGFEVKKETYAADGKMQFQETNEYRDGLLRSKVIENVQGNSTRRIAYGYNFGPGSQQTR